MKIALIIHSNTGNTLSVAEIIKEKLLAGGHDVSIERVASADANQPPASKVVLTAIPDPTLYDAVIFGAPVHAFSVSSVMGTYLYQMPELKNVKAACYVTHQFPFAWLGGNRAVKQMAKACGIKAMVVADTGVVDWSNRKRNEEISELAARFSKLF